MKKSFKIKSKVESLNTRHTDNTSVLSFTLIIGKRERSDACVFTPSVSRRAASIRNSWRVIQEYARPLERHLTEYGRGLRVNYAQRRILSSIRRIARPLSRARDNELHDEMPKCAIISLITSVPLTPYFIFLIVNVLDSTTWHLRQKHLTQL